MGPASAVTALSFPRVPFKCLHFLCVPWNGRLWPLGHTGYLFARQLPEGYLQCPSHHSWVSVNALASSLICSPSPGKAYLTLPDFVWEGTLLRQRATEEYLPRNNRAPLCSLLCFPFVVIWMTGIIWPLPTSNAVWGWKQASKHVLNPLFLFISTMHTLDLCYTSSNQWWVTVTLLKVADLAPTGQGITAVSD